MRASHVCHVLSRNIVLSQNISYRGGMYLYKLIGFHHVFLMAQPPFLLNDFLALKHDKVTLEKVNRPTIDVCICLLLRSVLK